VSGASDRNSRLGNQFVCRNEKTNDRKWRSREVQLEGKQVLVTGGAGFVGSNLANHLAERDCRVTVFDSLARRGSQHNIRWLLERHPHGNIQFQQGDIRDAEALTAAVGDADVVFHLAAQVAVTTSVENPRHDFDVNALGTFNVLEAVRSTGREVPLVFTSTNKVYGGMETEEVEEQASRYAFRKLPHGVSETQPLDFHSPYGCSKGAADQYVRDYGRIYGLPTVVFRMSCIYGPRQFGNEDQGWVAHFMIAAQTGQPLTIYGNGKQVRDILYVGDLVRAFQAAVESLDRTAGQIFNIGGGPSNTLAIWREFGPHLTELHGRRVAATYADWRPGDQPCYVSDIRKAAEVMGWRPEISKEEGIRRLWQWVAENSRLFPKPVEHVAPVAAGEAQTA
jgi:CDP-paratose 2-epimerase